MPPGFMLHILVAVRTAKVWHPAVGVVTEIVSRSRANIPHVVNSLLGFIIPIKLSGNERTLGSVVSLIHGGGRPVVVLPAAHHISGAGVQIVRLEFTSIIVVILVREACPVVC